MKNLQPNTLIKNPTGCRVTSAVVLSKDAQSVWSIVGNFSDFTTFIPALSYIEMLGTGVGCLRKKLFKDGNIVVEQLNSHDDRLMHMTWSTLFNTLGIGNLWASMSVKALSDRECLATWNVIADLPTNALQPLEDLQNFVQVFIDDAMANVRILSERQSSQTGSKN